MTFYPITEEQIDLLDDETTWNFGSSVGSVLSSSGTNQLIDVDNGTNLGGAVAGVRLGIRDCVVRWWRVDWH